jgi:hypothetical protein
MSNKIDMIYKFNGKGSEDGIDIFELSPVLLSFGRLITESHAIIYPTNPRIAVNVKPFQKGSFEIDLLMFTKGHLQQILDFMNSQKGQDIKNVLEWIGLITTASGVTLLGLISFLKGRAKSIEKLNSGEFRYSTSNNETITVDSQVNSLYQNCQIQQTIYNGIGKPLEIEGIDNSESFLKAEPDKTRVVHEKAIAEPLKTYSESELPSTDEEKNIENRRVLWLHPRRGSFEGEPNAWSFRIGENEAAIKATIHDESFLENIKTGAIRLAQPDVIKAEIIERQKMRGNTIMPPTYEIVKVLDYKMSAQQTALNLPNDDQE